MYILFFLLILFIGVYFKYNNNTFLIFGIIVCALYFIPLFYIIFFFNCKNNEIIRIDCIYSKDFENMFIGLVKMNEKSYKNTFLLKMSDIKEFVIENKDIDSNILVLKVIFTNGSIQDICRINNRTIKELNGLIVHLNKRLNKDNNSMQNESLYPITPYENI